MPLVNRYSSHAEPAEAEPRFPLDLACCPTCSLVQITETVDPAVLFSDYLYLSSYSDTMLMSAKALVGQLVAQRSLGSSSLVVELASNDGYLLQFYRERGIPVLGVDPAENAARIAWEQRQIPTLVDFFDESLARKIAAERGHASVVHANNVLAHVADLNGFVAGISVLLGPSGVAVLEVPYLRWLIERGEFDTIYHEHLCYFAISSLTPLLARHGLQMTHVDQIPIHGGSIRLFIEKFPAHADDSVTHLLDEELAMGLGSPDNLRQLGIRAGAIRTQLAGLLGELRDSGARIAAYGAAAKGTVLLNYCRIGNETIDYVVDRNVHKQNRLLPGLRIPILDPLVLQDDRPDYLLVLAWNILDEVMMQQQEFRARGGRFIVPIPEARVVE